MNNREVGSQGEDNALVFLKKEYKILEKNYTSKYGEIDIIAMDKKTIVFIEVKYRKDLKKGRPCEAVDYYKQKKIIRTAVNYIQKKKLVNINARFDIIEIVGEKISIIKNAFDMSIAGNYL